MIGYYTLDLTEEFVSHYGLNDDDRRRVESFHFLIGKLCGQIGLEECRLISVPDKTHNSVQLLLHSKDQEDAMAFKLAWEDIK